MAHSTFTDPEEGEEHDTSVDLEALCRPHLAGGVAAEYHEGPERPWLELIGLAQRKSADLIMVGRRVDPEPQRLPMGMVARRLLRHSPVPVWVVPPDASVPPAGRILVATDLSPVGVRVGQIGGELSTLLGTELHVVHAYGVSTVNRMEWGQLPQEEAEAAFSALHAQITQKVRDSLGAYADQATLHVSRDAPARMIRAAVEALQPSLLVMGTLSRTGVAGMLVGNTAERIINEVECALLTVKPEGFRDRAAAD